MSFPDRFIFPFPSQGGARPARGTDKMAAASAVPGGGGGRLCPALPSAPGAARAPRAVPVVRPQAPSERCRPRPCRWCRAGPRRAAGSGVRGGGRHSHLAGRGGPCAAGGGRPGGGAGGRRCRPRRARRGRRRAAGRSTAAGERPASRPAGGAAAAAPGCVPWRGGSEAPPAIGFRGRPRGVPAPSSRPAPQAGRPGHGRAPRAKAAAPQARRCSCCGALCASPRGLQEAKMRKEGYIYIYLFFLTKHQSSKARCYNIFQATARPFSNTMILMTAEAQCPSPTLSTICYSMGYNATYSLAACFGSRHFSFIIYLSLQTLNFARTLT